MTWRKVKLSEIFDIARGGSPRPIDSYLTDAPDAVNWISIKDASESGKYIRSTKLKIKPEGASKSRFVKPGDFLLTNSMSFGRPYIMQTTGCIHDGWLVLSDKSGSVDPDFLYYLLGSPQMYQEFAKRAAGAVVKNLNIDLVKGVSIPLPPLEVQKKIAAVLEKADALRRKREEQIKRLDDLLQATFLDMFGDPVTNPKGWPIIKLKDVVDKVTSGSTPKGGESSYLSEGILFVRSQNVLMQSLDLDKAAFIGSDVHQSMKRSALEHLDVLLNITGASIGRVAVFDLKEQANVNQHVCLIRCKMQEIEPYFLAFQIGSANFQQKYISMNSGATREAFNYEEIKNFNLILPPMQQQKQFNRSLLVDDIKTGSF